MLFLQMVSKYLVKVQTSLVIGLLVFLCNYYAYIVNITLF